MMKKTCRTCLVEKSLEGNFTRHSKGSLRLDCNKCRSKAWTDSNRDPKKREHRKKIGKGSKLKKAYGLTLSQFEEMAKAQLHICGNPGCDTKLNMDKKTHVDHCHKTKKIRGLLCEDCNKALGLIHESSVRAVGLAKYITMHGGL